MREIKIEINSLGRVKPRGKGLGQQYENNVTKYVFELASSLMNDAYFYYIVVVPPSSSKQKQYAVPLINTMEYLITSKITQYVGNYKFCLLIMSEELTGNAIPVDGVINISDEWEDEVVKGILSPDELSEQPEDANFTIAYEELLKLKGEIEANSKYAKDQGDYAKKTADDIIAAKEAGVFNGPKGDPGEPGPEGPSGKNGKFEELTDEEKASLKGDPGEKGEPGANGQTPYIGDNGNWWIGEIDTGVSATGSGGGSGTGDMLKSVYDTDGDGVVDNAKRVNGHTVESDIPVGIDFTKYVKTDEVYSKEETETKISEAIENIDIPETSGTYTLPDIGKSQTVQTLYGDYTLETIQLTQKVKLVSTPVSSNIRVEGIISSSSIRCDTSLENTSFDLTFNGETEAISFGVGEGIFDAASSTVHTDIQNAFQQKLDDAFGVGNVTVEVIPSGARYKIKISSSGVVVVTSGDSDMLSILKITSGATNLLDTSITIAKFLDTEEATETFTINDYTNTISTSATLEEFFNAINGANIGVDIAYSILEDAIIMQGTSEINLSATLGIFEALGFNEAATLTTQDVYLVDVTAPDGTVTENIELTANNFNSDGVLALLTILQQDTYTKVETIEKINEAVEAVDDKIDAIQTIDRYNKPEISYDGTNYINTLDIPLALYETGKILNIEGVEYTDGDITITSFENPYLDINGLGAKQINGTIEAGQQYSLVYNGDSWDIQEPDFVVGTYTGDNQASQFVDLGFTPSAVLVTTSKGLINSDSTFFGGLALKDYPVRISTNSYIVEIVDNGFKVFYNTSTKTYSNSSGESPYHYIAFKPHGRSSTAGKTINQVVLTQAEYDALVASGTVDESTMYFIKEG